MAPCGNATPRALKDRWVTLKREDRVLEPQKSRLIPKQRSTKPRYRRTCHRIMTQTYKEKIKPAKLSREQLQGIREVMRDLHLPFPPSNERRANISKEMLPSHLRWSTDEDWNAKEVCWKYVKYSEEQRCSSPEYASPRGPCWNLPPNCVIHLGILNTLIHFKRTCWRNSVLQIPSYWPVFEAASWDPAHFLSCATTDSSEGRAQKHPSSHPERHTPFHCEDECDQVDRENVTCQSEGILATRLRGFWSFLSTILPDRFEWRHQTKERARRRNQKRHVGYLDLNQKSRNCDIWPQKSIEALVSCWERGGCPPELSWPSIFGRLIANVVATDMFPAQSRDPLHWPTPFAQLGDMPVIDYTCRVRKGLMGWQGDFSPLLFAAQYRIGDMEHAVKQLAMAFQPMMTLFVLYHLDCRKSTEEPLPPWMILYGAIYDENGLTIHTHNPYFSPPFAGTAAGPNWGWSSVASYLRHDYPSMVNWEPNARGSCIATLSRIQGHCAHVLEKLKAWDGYDHAVSRILQAQAP